MPSKFAGKSDKRVLFATIVAAVVLAGYVVFMTRAAGVAVPFEAESSTLANGATTGSVSSASGGSFVQFHQPAAGGGQTCPAYPAFPDASCTGVPAGTSLTASGSITISSPGIVEGKDVSGTVTINASNVTFRKSRVRSTQFANIRVADGMTNVLIEDCEVDGLTGGDNTMGILGAATVRRCDISHVENGFNPFAGSVIEDSYIHDLSATSSPHYDGIQIDGGDSNITIRHNTVDLHALDQTSAVMMDNCFGGLDNLTVTQNLLSGAGFTLYHAANFPNHFDSTCQSGKGTNSPHLTNISITNNHFGPSAYGPALICRDRPAAWSGNVNHATGAIIPEPALNTPAGNCPFND